MDEETQISGANPAWDTDRVGGRANCSNVVVAAELRRRGIQCVAAPRLAGRDVTEIASVWEKDGNPVNVIPIFSPRVFDDPSSSPTRAEIVESINGYPDGSSGSMSVAWMSGGSHIFTWRKENGKVKFLEGQTTTVDPESYFGQTVGHVFILRMDDAEFVGNIDEWVRPV